MKAFQVGSTVRINRPPLLGCLAKVIDEYDGVYTLLADGWPNLALPGYHLHDLIAVDDCETQSWVEGMTQILTGEKSWIWPQANHIGYGDYLGNSQIVSATQAAILIGYHTAQQMLGDTLIHIAHGLVPPLNVTPVTFDNCPIRLGLSDTFGTLADCFLTTGKPVKVVIVEDRGGRHYVRCRPDVATPRSAVAESYGFQNPTDYWPEIRT